MIHISLSILLFVLQAQSDEDDVGPDDVAVNVEGRDGFMDEFFNEVSPFRLSASEVVVPTWRKTSPGED